MNSVYYTVNDPDFADYLSFEGSNILDCPEDYVEEIASYYWDNHDGWAEAWPLDFYIWNESKELLGKYEVHMESVPVFYACGVY